MRPPEFKDDQVIEAGRQLEQEQKRVTGFALRKVIGGGNPSRLKGVWETFVKSHEVIEADPVQVLPIEVQEGLEVMSAELSEQLTTLVRAMNARAVSTAESRVSELVKAARNEHEKAAAELHDAEIAFSEVEDDLLKANRAYLENEEKLKSAYEIGEMQKAENIILVKQQAVKSERVKSLNEENKLLRSQVSSLNGLSKQVETLQAQLLKLTKNK